MKAFLLLVAIFFIFNKNYSQTNLNSPYKIESIKAFLFYNQDKSTNYKNVAGTFSPNIIDNDSLALWNVIIGEGDALGCSDQTLVVVEISGNPKEFVQRQLSFNAIAEGKVLLDKKIKFAIIDHTGRYYAIYILYETGCHKIKLTAKIIGVKVESQMEKFINYQCGD